MGAGLSYLYVGRYAVFDFGVFSSSIAFDHVRLHGQFFQFDIFVLKFRKSCSTLVRRKLSRDGLSGMSASGSPSSVNSCRLEVARKAGSTRETADSTI